MPDRQAPDNSKKSYGARLVMIYEIAIQHGPLPIKALADRAGLPKVSAWRVVRELREHGWLRIRHADGMVEACTRLDIMQASGHQAHPEAADVDRFLTDIDLPKSVSVVFWAFETKGTLAVVDALRADDRGPVSLVHAGAGAAALVACTRRDVIRHLEVYSRFCPPSEAALINSGQTLADLDRHARNGGVIPTDDSSGVALPWLYPSGEKGAIVLGFAGDATRDPAVLDRILPTILPHCTAIRKSRAAQYNDAPSLLDEADFLQQRQK